MGGDLNSVGDFNSTFFFRYLDQLGFPSSDFTFGAKHGYLSDSREVKKRNGQKC